MKRMFLVTVGCVMQACLFAQTFSTEFSAEMQKVDGKMEVAPQLKGILGLPLNRSWAMELELASSQPGLDFRADATLDFWSAKRKQNANAAAQPQPDERKKLPVSLLAGISSGDACNLYFADLGVVASIKDTECTAILHYAPFASSHDKYLEITAQRDFGCFYLQPGMYVNHVDKTVSITGVLTLGISLDLPNSSSK